MFHRLAQVLGAFFSCPKQYNYDDETYLVCLTQVLGVTSQPQQQTTLLQPAQITAAPAPASVQQQQVQLVAQPQQQQQQKRNLSLTVSVVTLQWFSVFYVCTECVLPTDFKIIRNLQFYPCLEEENQHTRFLLSSFSLTV